MTDSAEKKEGRDLVVERLQKVAAERQVGERLSEQEEAQKIAEDWVKWFDADSRLEVDATWKGRIARAYLDQARQLADAERENGRLREVAHQIVGFSRSGLSDNATIRAIATNAEVALNPPDPPASPAEGSEAATEVEGAG